MNRPAGPAGSTGVARSVSPADPGRPTNSADLGRPTGPAESERAARKDEHLELAVRLHDTGMALEERRKDVDGNLERVVPQYMDAVVAWKS